MKKIITISIIALMSCVTAQAQSAIRQLESMTGATISRGSAESSRYGSGYGFDRAADALFDRMANAVDAYPEARADAWAARKAAQEAARNKAKYSRTSHYKLKDVKPIDPKAKKTLPAGLGATGDLAVYAKYDKNAVPTYGIWNTAKSKWQYKPKYSALKIVGPHAAAATLKGKVGIIDPTTGKPVMDFTFDKFQAFHYPDCALNTMIALGKTSPEGHETWYVMQSDASGNYVQVGPELSAINCYEDGTGYKAAYRTADTHKVGMLDEHGNEVLPPVFDGLKYLNFVADEASCYQSRLTDENGTNHYGVIDDKGKSIVPCIYDRIDVPNNGKYGVQVVQSGKLGWYGTDGVEIFPAVFDNLQMDHFWDGNKHRAYFRGSFIDDNGDAHFALFDTRGNRLTEFSDHQISEDAIKGIASSLEEYRIY